MPMDLSRPLPQPTADTAPYWEGLARGVITLPHCPACRHAVFPPRPFCPSCLGRDLEWSEIPARGRLLTWSVVHRATLPAFFGETPYVYALVELAGGVRVPTRIVTADFDRLEMGLEVEAVFEPVENATLLYFRMV